MTKTVLLIGTLDTKGEEYQFVKDLLIARGLEVLTANAGVLGDPPFEPDYSAIDVTASAGTTLQILRDGGDRGQAMEAMGRGLANLVEQLYEEGKFDGVMALGGGGGTAISTEAMRRLPVGIPKLMVSTVASGDVGPYVGETDITMMYSVVDIAGINQISRPILANAAGAIAGMVEQDAPAGHDKPLIAATMFGVTTPCVTRLREKMEGLGYEVVVFHATGSGGRAMEGLIESGFFKGVADVTTTEWCDQLVGGVLSAGPNRLEAAVKSGVPQVVSLGALDMVNFWARDTVPSEFEDRLFYEHNSNVTLMRTTPEEATALGRIIAQKLSRTTGPTTLLIPLQGVSAIDKEGELFFSPDANEALFQAIRDHIHDSVDLVELDLHINDDAFADALVEHLVSNLEV